MLKNYNGIIKFRLDLNYICFFLKMSNPFVNLLLDKRILHTSFNFPNNYKLIYTSPQKIGEKTKPVLLLLFSAIFNLVSYLTVFLFLKKKSIVIFLSCHKLYYTRLQILLLLLI